MAQPNAAREPSMEEILASIRRIIESNEPVTGRPLAMDDDQDDGEEPEWPAPRQAPAAMVQPQVQVAVPQRSASVIDEPLARSFTPANSSEPMRAPQVQVHIQQPQPAAPAAVQTTSQAPRAISLADVAARVRAASERNGLSGDAAEEAPVPRPVEEPRMRSVELRGSTTAQMRPIVPMIDELEIEDEVPAAELELAELAEQTVAEDDFEIETGLVSEEPAYDDEPVYHTDHFADSTSRDGQAMALLSGETEHMVARSFNELADVLDLAARRSLDEVAEEMLRPMLQEWLDDNLPTLVERLVREEIERVARGTRR